MNIQRLVQENGVRPAQHFRAVIYICVCVILHMHWDIHGMFTGSESEVSWGND